MEPNGRTRTHSSNASLPTSSTFRRLPALTKRRDKAPSPDISDTTHQRGYTFPISSRFVEESSEPDHTGNHLLPPSRTSSLPQTPSPEVAPSLSSPYNLTQLQSSLDLEPITYPSHLASSKPPEHSRLEMQRNRPRDFTLGLGATIMLGGAVSTTSPVPGGRQGSIHDHRIDPSRRPSVDAAGSADSGLDETVTRRRRATTTTRSTRPAETLKPVARRPTRPSLPVAKVVRSTTSSMYFSAVPAHGSPPTQALRAHTGTLVGDQIWLIGGVDSKHCWRGAAWFDTEALSWSTIETSGEQMPPLRAHTTTLVGTKLYVFGGGDGPTYSNDVWTFDTISHRFARPNIATHRGSLPLPRRAHTTVLYGHYLVVFGGGNGQAALNDVWALDVSDPDALVWQEWRTTGSIPQKKGYHTANLVGHKMVVFGGSDGHASFADVHILNLETLTWTLVTTDVKHNRLSHTSTQVGSYLFIIGGHNGQTYAQDVLLFNLVTLQWENKATKGIAPPGRGYHVALLHDARIFISGGYNGVAVFDDLWTLDLSAGAYLPQVTTFEVYEHQD